MENYLKLCESAWNSCVYRHQQGHHGEFHLVSSSGGMTCRNGEVERGYSCWSSKTWWWWSCTLDRAVTQWFWVVGVQSPWCFGLLPGVSGLFLMAFLVYLWVFLFLQERNAWYVLERLEGFSLLSKTGGGLYTRCFDGLTRDFAWVNCFFKIIVWVCFQAWSEILVWQILNGFRCLCWRVGILLGMKGF